MGQTKGTKRTGSTASVGIQQQISTMFGEKVKKPRMYMGSTAPTKPIEKPGTPQLLSKTDNGSAVPITDSVASQKRRWRLAELIKKERENRMKTSHMTPSFVFEAPHMDTRRPQYVGKPNVQTKSNRSSDGPPRKKTKLSPDSVKHATPNAASNSAQVRGLPGAEALLHDRFMLPSSHALLLDVLQGLESAISLLRTRKAPPTVAAVREIVSRSTRRTFTLRILSQLAHTIPEAVAVLPGITAASKLKRPSENLIVRLDDVDTKSEKSLDAPREDTSSALGDSPARMRRSLLHKRLLSHVREHHERFLLDSKVVRYNGNMWHPDFDLETDVPNLSAPPLYPIQSASVRDNNSGKPDKSEGPVKVKQNDPGKQPKEHTESEASEDHQDVGIPRTLLERVRVREKERSRIARATEVERTANRSLLTKLPCTMDTILSILRGERRSAIGWLQLLTRLEKLHPQKWAREDLEAQLIAITSLASNWCRKAELKSSRGGFAFRVTAPEQFAAARDKVSATKCFPVEGAGV